MKTEILIKTVVTEYLQHLALAGKSPATITKYESVLKKISKEVNSKYIS